jgi:hypothetical protein
MLWMTLNKDLTAAIQQELLEHFRQICDSTLRVLGGLYHHEGSEYQPTDWPDYSSAKASFKDFVRAIRNDYNVCRESIDSQ